MWRGPDGVDALLWADPSPYTGRLGAVEPCQGCFLYERRGICSTARDAYGLQNPAEAQRRAEVLHAAVLRDAEAVPACQSWCGWRAVNTP